MDFLLGAGTGDRVFGALTARRTGRTATITTEDGSLGSRGLVTDMLDQVIHDGRTDVIYACGPMPMLRQVTRWRAGMTSRSRQPSKRRWPAASASA